MLKFSSQWAHNLLQSAHTREAQTTIPPAVSLQIYVRFDLSQIRSSLIPLSIRNPPPKFRGLNEMDKLYPTTSYVHGRLAQLHRNKRFFLYSQKLRHGCLLHAQFRGYKHLNLYVFENCDTKAYQMVTQGTLRTRARHQAF